MILIATMILAIAAESPPATTPTTVPSRASLDAAESRLAAAESSLAEAREAALRAFDLKESTIAAKQKLAHAERQMEVARKSGGTRERMAASSEYNSIRAAVDQSTADFLESDTTVRAANAERVSADIAATVARMQFDAANEQADRIAKQEALDAEARDPIKTAIRNRTIIVGMTLAEAQLAMGKRGFKRLSTDDGVEVYEWSFEREPIAVKGGWGFKYAHTWTGTFRDGVLMTVEHAKEHVGRAP